MHICGRPNVARNSCTKDCMATHVAHTLFRCLLACYHSPHGPHFLLPHKQGKDSWKPLQRFVELSPPVDKALAKPHTAILTHPLLHEPPAPITLVIPHNNQPCWRKHLRNGSRTSPTLLSTMSAYPSRAA
eukprot:11260650-Ditylum_brightwellii.AAC.1